ncbi:MAG: ATP-dependent zinc protease [Candidatus Thiodiazotropha taylori]|nr:ATP-dependent zinc protease [Candidatus Thiodiazotropha taylori]
MSNKNNLIGWREWLILPELGIQNIKAKIDTGARTSALHAFSLKSYQESGIPMVRFGMHPLQNNTDFEQWCTAKVIDEREVTDSGGHRESRFVIRTPVKLGPHQWDIEVTLTNRDTMKFRMLLGRTAIAGHFSVDPEASYLYGKPRKNTHRPAKQKPKK